jgi:ribosomal 30S subunit maturation factor RimM
MEVTGDRTRLIPWIATVVRDVDLARRQVHIEWQEDW